MCLQVLTLYRKKLQRKDENAFFALKNFHKMHSVKVDVGRWIPKSKF